LIIFGQLSIKTFLSTPHSNKNASAYFGMLTAPRVGSIGGWLSLGHTSECGLMALWIELFGGEGATPH